MHFLVHTWNEETLLLFAPKENEEAPFSFAHKEHEETRFRVRTQEKKQKQRDFCLHRKKIKKTCFFWRKHARRLLKGVHTPGNFSVV